ncbi:MAG TPA: WYL domain-containing protein [Acidimicrobiales bacterium]|nr:WYL domain-containing protein [Acidimicrobiales bacterium]
MSRLERLLNLTAALLNASRPLTAAELQARVPGYPDYEDRSAFRRAFERDKDALKDMGIPLELEEITDSDPRVEGYTIRRDQYALRNPGLDTDELAALHLATAAVRLEGLRGNEAIWKLGGAPATPAPTSAAVAAIPAIPALTPLFSAVAERRTVTFGYRDRHRVVDPYRLSYARGRWYLDGFDHDRVGERRFRLDRIDGEVEAGEPGVFDRPDRPVDGTPQPWQMGDEAPVAARLRIDVDQAGWAVDHIGPDALVDHLDDGSVEVTLTVTNRDAFRSFALGFLDHAEVLEPAELRDDMVAWLRALVS